MVKGCERRVVIYKTKESRYFSEAHFIMKDGLELDRERRRDVIEEANRIVRECSFDRKKKIDKKGIFLRVLFVFGGFLAGFFARFIFSLLF